MPNDKSNVRRLCGVRFGVEEFARRFCNRPPPILVGVSGLVPADFVIRNTGLYDDTRFGVISCDDGTHSTNSTSEFEDTITLSAFGLLRTSKGNPSKHFDDSVTLSLLTVSDNFRFDFVEASVISLFFETRISLENASFVVISKMSDLSSSSAIGNRLMIAVASFADSNGS